MDVDSQEKDDTITEPSGTEVLQDKVSEPSTSQTVHDDADDTATSNTEMTDDVANPITDLTGLPIASGTSLSQHLDAKTYQFLLRQGSLQEVVMPADVDVQQQEEQQQQQQTMPLNMSMTQPSAQIQGSLHPSAQTPPPPPTGEVPTKVRKGSSSVAQYVVKREGHYWCLKCNVSNYTWGSDANKHAKQCGSDDVPKFVCSMYNRSLVLKNGSKEH